jgi:hypothetical protein
MNLAPPPVGELYVTHHKLIAAVNEHAGLHGYAVVMKRSKKSRKDVICKVTLRCDREGKPNNVVGQKRLHSGSRLIECPLDAQGKWLELEGGWMLIVKNSAHNHDPTLRGSHSAIRKLTMTDEIRGRGRGEGRGSRGAARSRGRGRGRGEGTAAVE